MKNKIIKRIFLLIIVVICLFQNVGYAENTINIQDVNNVSSSKDIFKDIEARNLLLAETKTGRILYERNVAEKIYPASLTKLMTAILVVENCELDEIVTISENAVFSVPMEYVNANLQVGEELTVED